MGFRKKTLALTGSATSAADLIASTPSEDFAHFCVQITGTFVGSVQWQGSNDGTNWIALRAQNCADATAVLGVTTTPGMYRGMLGCRYMRVTCTAYTSGTITAALLLHPDAIPSMVKST